MLALRLYVTCVYISPFHLAAHHHHHCPPLIDSPEREKQQRAGRGRARVSRILRPSAVSIFSCSCSSHPHPFLRFSPIDFRSHSLFEGTMTLSNVHHPTAFIFGVLGKILHLHLHVQPPTYLYCPSARSSVFMHIYIDILRSCDRAV